MDILDNIGEYIIPLIIAGIYFFSNLLSKKSKNNDEDNYEQPTWTPPQEDEYEPHTIQESTPELTAYDKRQLERSQAAQAHREQREALRRDLPPLSPHTMAPPPLPEEAAPVVSSEPPIDAYASTIERQLKRIEETKRKAEQINQQVGTSGAKKAQRAKRPVSSPRFSGSIRSQLQDPAAARKAFILAEVFGPCASSGERSKIPGIS